MKLSGPGLRRNRDERVSDETASTGVRRADSIGFSGHKLETNDEAKES